MMLHLLRPFWLLALLPALLLWWSFRRQADSTRRWRDAIDPDLLRNFIAGSQSKTWLRPGDALLAAWVIGTVAVAGPSWQREPSPFATDAPPVMIVLKVTPSMLASDLQPSRLERAQQKIGDLLRLQPGQAAGLIAYAGSAHLVLPPTQDAAVVVTMARALSPAVMPKPGDALSDAVALARSVLAEGGKGGSVLVLADEANALPAPPLSGAPVTLLPMLPTGQEPGGGLGSAARTLGAEVATLTIDTADVAKIGHALATAGGGASRPGETDRWQDGGWYLVPVLALVVLLWFRRGWTVLG